MGGTQSPGAQVVTVQEKGSVGPWSAPMSRDGLGHLVMPPLLPTVGGAEPSRCRSCWHLRPPVSGNPVLAPREAVGTSKSAARSVLVAVVSQLLEQCAVPS